MLHQKFENGMMEIKEILVWLSIFSVFSSAGAIDVSKNFTELLANYDYRVRPYAYEKPVVVRLQVSIMDLGPVLEKDFTFRVDMYLRFWWYDPRLELKFGNLTFNGNPPKTIWIPDLYIKNSRDVISHSFVRETSRTTIDYRGNVYLSTRLTAICSCQMDLHFYPHDNQTCQVKFESYSFSNDNLDLQWHQDKQVEYFKDDIQIEGYELTNIQSTRNYKHYDTGESHQNLELSFLLDRTFSYYLTRSYVPSALLVFISWSAFWLPLTAYPARVTLIVTNFLASAFVLQGASAQLPRVPYTTAIELFLMVNITFIIAALIEYIIALQRKTNGLRKTSRKDLQDTTSLVVDSTSVQHSTGRKTVCFVHTTNLDHLSRIAFPFAYSLFLIGYYIYYSQAH